MNYLIAVYPDRIAAEAAYTDLEKADIPKTDLVILGKGYQTADEFGFIDPSTQGKKQAKLYDVYAGMNAAAMDNLIQKARRNKRIQRRQQ